MSEKAATCGGRCSGDHAALHRTSCGEEDISSGVHRCTGWHRVQLEQARVFDVLRNVSPARAVCSRSQAGIVSSHVQTLSTVSTHLTSGSCRTVVGRKEPS